MSVGKRFVARSGLKPFGILTSCVLVLVVITAQMVVGVVEHQLVPEEQEVVALRRATAARGTDRTLSRADAPRISYDYRVLNKGGTKYIKYI